MNGRKKSKAMDEVHQWREALYEEIQQMNIQEKISYFHRGTEEVANKYQMKILSPK